MDMPEERLLSRQAYLYSSQSIRKCCQLSNLRLCRGRYAGVDTSLVLVKGGTRHAEPETQGRRPLTVWSQAGPQYPHITLRGPPLEVHSIEFHVSTEGVGFELERGIHPLSTIIRSLWPLEGIEE